MEDVTEDLGRLLEFAPEEEVDEYSRKRLKKKVYEWKNKEKEYLSDLEYFINGKEYTSILEALYFEEELTKMKINFFNPNLEGDWNFSRPTKELMEKRGKGMVRTFDYDPSSLNKWRAAKELHNEKAMVRAYISHFFVPVSIKTKSQYHHAREIPRQYDPRLKKISMIWEDVREGVLPFKIRVCIYTPEERYTYILDPLEDRQRPHPLSMVPYHRRKDHEPIEYMHLDKILARIEIPDLLKNLLEFIFEVGEVTIADVAHTFGLSPDIAKNNLKSLQSKGLLKIRKDDYYRVPSEDLKEKAEEYG